jgi:DNA-binding GntR family transcriptional regulator
VGRMAAVGAGMHLAMVDPSIDRPVYLQIADELRAMIESGEIPPRHVLPSVNTLVQRYGVADQTVRKAVGVLRAEGLVHTVNGKGTYVSPR